MAIVKVQSVTGNGATLALTGVAAGNWLTLIDSYFRTTSTGVGETVPTDSNGTFLKARGDAPSVLNGQDIGVGIFYEENVTVGTHTVTPQANSGHNTTLAEYSGMATSGSLDATVSSGTSSGTGTSQSTGTTPTTVQAVELSISAFGMGATVNGNTNVGLTDPVTNYTTLQINQNDSTDVATQHIYRILSATGTQAVTFNWTFSDAGQMWQAAIATFKGATSAVDQIYPSYPDEVEDISRDQEPWDWYFNYPLPPNAVADTVSELIRIYDSSLEQEQPDDEAFGFEFWLSPSDVDASLQGIIYDSSLEQEQPDDEDYGFYSSQVVQDTDMPGYIIYTGSDDWEERDGEDYGFISNPLLLDVDFVFIEDASWMLEDDEALLDFLDNFVVNNAVVTTGHVIVFFDGLNVAGGLNYHKDVARPIVILTPVGDGTFNVTKVSDLIDERPIDVHKETITIDGDIP